MKKFLRILGILILVLVVSGYFFVTSSNNYEASGDLQLKGLEAPVRVIRDDKGMPYIHAKSLHDLMMAQGYVMAQDRLFQMQLTRMFAQGRISELAGEQAKGLDVRMRTYGFYRHALKHKELLDKQQLAEWQAFVDGVNSYIQSGKNQHVEFSLAGIKADLWEVEHCIAVLYYMGWGGAGNMSSEALSQMIIDQIGTDKFLSILPLYTNLDDKIGAIPDSTGIYPKKLNASAELSSLLDKSGFQIQWGSNNWAADGNRSTSGKPLLASDPHLDARILPGTMYACGLFTDDIRAVGVTIPGMPGLIIGRNEYISNGITNAYLDMQDLYIEKLDPTNEQNYLEGDQSTPFEIIKEQLLIKDSEVEGGLRTEEFEIRLTHRGPVVSEVIPDLKTKHVLTLRWAAAENMKSTLGLDHLLKAKSVTEALQVLEGATMACNNVVLAGTDGTIAWQTVGSIPYRTPNAGRFPQAVQDTSDNWTGIVAYDSMPRQVGADRGWIGNANHKTIPHNFPYYVSNSYAPKYRYERLKVLMGSKDKFSPDDFWQFQRDIYNVLAAKYAPRFAEVLLQQAETKELGLMLSTWDYVEDLESVETGIFHTVYRRLAYLTFIDELGEDLGMKYLKNWYFWQERFDKMLDDGTSPWFDNIQTQDKTESLDDLIAQAGIEAKKELSSKYGEEISEWTWQTMHQIEFVNPLRRKGSGKELVGGLTFPMAGSGETLYRAKYNFNDPEKVVFHAALRMVADMGDSEKVLAVLPGGITGRTFHEHFNDQAPLYINGTKTYWWFSPEQIEKHKVDELHLNP